MIGQIGPLVQAGSGRRLLVAHIFGGISGGATSGLVLGTLGSIVVGITAIFGLPVGGAVPWVVAAIGIFGIAVDLTIVTPKFAFQRQTPQSWECALGSTGAAFMWGADLGTGITTRLPRYSLLALIAIAFGSTPIGGMAAMGCYGLGKAFAVVLGASRRNPPFACAIVDRNDASLILFGACMASAAVGVFLANLFG